MANENKNIKELVSEDDDPTAELEIPNFAQMAETDELHAEGDAERESDSNTYGFGDSDDAEKLDGQTIPELQSDLRTRTKTISQLQYDIQQLRAKWMGLETEISAREEIVNNLLQDKDKLSKTIDRKDKLLKKRNESIKSLKSELRQHSKDAKSLEERLAQQQLAVDEEASARADAEGELQTLRGDLEVSRDQIKETEAQLKQRNDDYAELERQLSEQQEAAAAQAVALEEEQQNVAQLRVELEAAEHEEKTLNAEINLHDELEISLEEKIAQLEELAAIQQASESEHLARLDASAQEIARLQLELETARRQSAAKIVQTQKTTSSVVSELQAQLEKTERYADDLRFRVQDNDELLANLTRRRDSLSAEVTSLTETNDSLSNELEAAQAAHAELQASVEQLKADHEQEIRTIRFELSEAQDSMVQSDDLNTQLASDLANTRSFKEELERMLMENEQGAQDRISELEKQVKKLSTTTEDFEQKLDTKNTAINVLLGELAKKTEQIDSIGEIEEVIQEIDNRMSERFDEPEKDALDQKGVAPASAERDRITRVLVGSIGDKELRFPLFKNRLTIGRTADNDIQLKTSYISRRHAVLLTEGDATRVIDWGSKNGVYVNSERVKECFLSNGDIVAVGNAKFRYEERPKRDA